MKFEDIEKSIIKTLGEESPDYGDDKGSVINPLVFSQTKKDNFFLTDCKRS